MSTVAVASAHGTRKSAIANVHIFTGVGEHQIRRSYSRSLVRKLKRKKGDALKLEKNISLQEYFSSLTSIDSQKFINEVLEKAKLTDKVRLLISCKGGGLKTQIQAARLALAKALVKMDEGLRPLVKEFLRTDARRKERHKVGLKGRRAGTQFSKR